MRWILNLCYLVVLTLAFPFLLYQAIRKGKYQAGWAEKFLGRVPVRAGSQRCLWLHAVSVGEVNLLAPLLVELQQRHPDWQCVISTTTKTGYELAQKKYAGRMVFYCPLDFSWAVEAALKRIRPDLLVLAELELWPNLIGAVHRRGIPVAIVNGRLSEKSFRGYQRLKWLVEPIFHQLTLVAAQTCEYAGRFRTLGTARSALIVSGNLKFDGARTQRDNLATTALRELAGIAADEPVLLAGSTQAPEEALALATFQSLVAQHPRLRLILVPRHPERFAEVATLLDQAGVTWQRRSELVAGKPVTSNSVTGKSPRILLVDTVGELGAWWGTATVAFVGGSLGQRGGQNMLEPAAYGAAVCFGPNTWNFRDIVAALLSREAAVVVRDGAELTAFVGRCLNDADYADELGSRAQELVLAGQGATARTVTALEALLPQTATADSPITSARAA